MANFNIDYLVVAGGGAGGGYYRGGGGGAGELKESASSIALSTGSPHDITVGAGGAGVVVSSDNGSNGNNGDNSTFYNITSLGGGGGSPGDGSSGNTGSDGGSGGGAGGNWGGAPAYGGSAIGTGLGNNGGYGGPGSSAWQCGGGGGGATQVGFNAGTSGTDGDGGAGKTYTAATSITGQAFSIAGGGGGANYTSGNITIGGVGGGAAGASGNSPYTSGPFGTNNTGGGGGGGNGVSPQGAGGGGGSGIVILRYTTADVAGYTTTGITPTEDTTTIPGQTILSFTTVGTGTITFTALTPPPPPITPFDGTRATTPVTDFDKSTSLPGLKLPSGTNANQPSGVQGMIRNDTGENTGGSTSAIEHHNGTNWQYFAATESVDNPLFASQNFNTVLYTGNGNTTAQPITGTAFTPDLVWIKTIDQATRHILTDSIRSVSSQLFSNENFSQIDYGEFNSFNLDGFTVKRNPSTDYLNQNGIDYVSWNWKAGGLTNKSADFNGSTSYIETDSGGTGLRTAIQSNPTSLSISLWVKTTQNAVEILFSDGNRSGTPAFGLNLVILSGGLPYFEARPTTGADVTGTSTTSVNNGQWHHICYTFGTTASKIYVDGVQSATTTALNGIKDATRNFLIGLGLNSGTPNDLPFTGQMNQFRIFTSELDQTQVTALYNETAADNSALNYPQNAGCIAAYPLGENANDLSNTYNGLAVNVIFGKLGYLTRNTEGTIESTVSANVAAGFSVVGYTGNGTAGSTIGTGLSAPAEMIIVKSTSISDNWWTWHKGLPNINYYVKLNLSDAQAVTTPGIFGGTLPTSSVFSVGADFSTNGLNNELIAYCWHSVPGYSKIDSYVGDGGTNNFISTGFEPAFVMIKRTDDPSNWRIFDNKRGTQKELYPNSSAAQPPSVSYINFNDLGFTLTNSGGWINNLNGKFIYMAFATS